jgi:hypothetical protein
MGYLVAVLLRIDEAYYAGARAAIKIHAIRAAADANARFAPYTRSPEAGQP